MTTDGDRYLRPSEAARFLGISPRWLGTLRRRGDGPPHTVMPAGGHPRYLESELRAWAASSRHGPPEAESVPAAAGTAG